MQFQIYRARETDLIEGCRRKERTAQKALYDHMAGKMFSLCCRYMKDRMDAEDVLVTAFMKVFDRIDQFKNEGSFEGWVRKIVVNESLSYLRKNKSMYIETEIEAANHEPDLNLADHSMEADELLKMVSELPSGYRIVFNMFAIDGYTHKEIAQQLGISENTSKSQLSRARNLLQSRLLDLEKFIQPKLNEQ